jgi:hypothetical protein
LGGSALGPSPSAISSLKSSRSWRCHRSCLLLVVVGGAQPRGGSHSSAIARLQGFSSRSPVATFGRWSSTRMTTSLVVERSELGCGLPPALSFKDVHHPCWGGGRAESGLHLPRGLAARFFLQHSREKVFASPAKEANFGYSGSAVSCRVPGSSAWVALVPLPALTPSAWMGRGCPPTARATVESCVGQAHPRLLPCRWLHWGDVQDVVRHGGDDCVLGRSCPHSRSEDGSEDLSACAGAAAIRRYSTGAQVAAVVGAEVVAATGEAPHCRDGCLRCETVSATCHRAPDSLALLASLSPPVGGWGRGPIRSSAHLEVITAAGEPLGAEVVVVAGAEVVAVAGDPSMQRWSPPLVGLSGASF